MSPASEHPGPDPDPQETQEWVEAVRAVVRAHGPHRAQELIAAVLDEARDLGAPVQAGISTPYVNTIAAGDEPAMPGDVAAERRLRSILRWNAMAMVLRANHDSSELGGHIASYQSIATLYEVGFNHFWRAPSPEHGGDLVYLQGHSSPGVYARAFLEGRLTETQLDGFRQELSAAPNGLSSYPHPWLMPDFWQFPTVSMGLGPMMAIYQARFAKYLHGRGILDTSQRKVWAFMGDGEMDEPESLGAISLGGREHLDNLIFVVNCNLQRLDGPVRGNGKIIQELEMDFRGAGWNVIKVVWGGRWDPLLADDHDGLLRKRMNDAVDGDYQTYKSRNGAFVREHFFGGEPGLAQRVAHLSDDEIWALNRGGLDAQKVYAAYAAAVAHSGQPTVILAKTIKGYGMGEAGEGQNITHQLKKMNEPALLAFRDRFELPLTDEQVRDAAYYRPPDDSPEMAVLRDNRERLGGSLPARADHAEPLPVPELSLFSGQLEGSGERSISTTMAFVRILAALVRDKTLGPRIVPIVPDESRTFGMEGMFRQLGIFSQVGQLYQPEDAEQLMFYREDRSGQILQEGINEPGAFSSWIAAATAYANHGVQMLPFYIYYSMFGFQRVGDLAWAAGDSRARGFLLGGTAGRTTLNGEGLQHEDGHSHLQAALIPNCVAYDPTFAYEVAVIVHDGMRRMLTEREDVFFYLTLMNENYPHPPLPEGSEEGILRGIHPLSRPDDARVTLLGSGTILREVQAGGQLLADDFGISADVWSATSFTELRRDGMAAERHNRLHPGAEPRVPYVAQVLDGRPRPVVAATDYMRAFPDQIRPYLGDRPFVTLGTDGFGRSDRRAALRSFFEVDRHHVVLAALNALGDADGAARAIERYEIDTEAQEPWAALIDIDVPDIGEFTDVPVIEILVAIGDTVEPETPLVTLESDKATMEIPSPTAGVVRELRVKIGDVVSQGSPLLALEASGNGAVAAEPAEPEPEPAAPEPAPAAPEPAPATDAPPYASPSVRRLARERGIDLSTLHGSGQLGRITVDDLASTGGSGASPVPGLLPWPQVDFARFGEIERVALTRIQKLSKANLARNWALIPHVTQHEDADITDLEAFRKQVNAEHPDTKITMVALVLKACVSALRAFPAVNASLDGDELVLKHYFHLGFAADTPGGLVVPVIRDVDAKGLLEIADELTALSAKARAGKLGPADMQGATFTVSSLGGIGGTAFTPIINAPEVAILGVSRSQMRPVWDGAAFVPRLIVPLSFSYDHRVIDGAMAARFCVHLAGVLADMRRVLL